MTIEEVDSRLSSAFKISPLLKSVDPPIGQLSKVYFFRYGPPWFNPLTGEEKYLYEEEFVVYFGDQERAARLERLGHGYYWGDVFDTEIDLCREE